MAQQIWGTFSVADHLRKRPFVADVLLYDCLVVPVVPVNDMQLRDYWHERDWRPAHQESLLSVLKAASKDLVWEVPWDSRKVQQFRTRRQMATAVAQEAENLASTRQNDPDRPAFQVTRDLLVETTRDLPEGVWAEVVSAYPSYLGFRSGIKSASNAIRKDDAPSAAIFGWEFFVPDDPAISDLDLLREAAALSIDGDFRRKRQAFHDWRRRLGPATHRQAVDEMRTLLEEYTQHIRKLKIKGWTKYGFTVAALAAPIVPLLAPAAVAGSVTTIATWAGGFFGAAATISEFGKTLDLSQGHHAAAMFHDARKRLGWHAKKRR